MTNLFDTHAHIGDEEDFALTLKEAVDAGVSRILLCGSDISSSFYSANFAEKEKFVYFSAGIHPHSASAEGKEISRLNDLYKHKKCIAIGECGLDYFYDFSKREDQISLFRKMIDIAYENHLPIVIHCRDKENSEQAYIDSFEILSDFAKSGGNFVMHCFAGQEKWLARFLELGAYIGFGGIITFSKADNVRTLLKLTPLDRILFETDSPYLAPVPHRGKTNNPKYLPLIVKKASEILSIDCDCLAEISLKNSFSLFKKIQKIENCN